jgi:tRNA G18 (ribose-2'-O)-methylase SpoU
MTFEPSNIGFLEQLGVQNYGSSCKAAVGTENWVPWEKRDTAYEVILELKEKGVQTIAVEQSDRSISWKDYSPSFPVALVAGHESDGVTQAALEVVDVIVELPMYGFNKSFNVWGTTAVMAYKVLETLETTKKGQRS